MNILDRCEHYLERFLSQGATVALRLAVIAIFSLILIHIERNYDLFHPLISIAIWLAVITVCVFVLKKPLGVL